jgi:hypothetical protein
MHCRLNNGDNLASAMVGLPSSCNIMINQFRKLAAANSDIFMDENKHFDERDYRNYKIQESLRRRRTTNRDHRLQTTQPYIAPKIRNRI